jgi:hypothetical protein
MNMGDFAARLLGRPTPIFYDNRLIAIDYVTKEEMTQEEKDVILGEIILQLKNTLEAPKNIFQQKHIDEVTTKLTERLSEYVKEIPDDISLYNKLTDEDKRTMADILEKYK